MKILHVIASINPDFGGVTEAVKNIIEESGASALQNEILCLDNPSSPYLTLRCKIHAMGPAKGPWAYSKTVLPWLLKNLQHYNVVIIHGLWLYQDYAVAKSMKQLKKSGVAVLPKIFLMPHGMLDPYFQKAASRKIKALRNYIYWKLIEANVVNNAAGILFTCEEEKLLARESFRPYTPQKELVVGLGIKSPPVYSTSMKESFYNHCPQVKGHPYFIFLGRIHEKKAVDLLIYAYEALLKKNELSSNENKVAIPKLVIAGPGTDSIFGTDLISYVSKNAALQNSVYFTGMLTGDAKWGAMYRCEAFVLPSHQENFGIAVVEALACGKPVIISNKINIWREIAASNCGLIGDDTKEGTLNLLNKWCMLSDQQKQLFAMEAEKSFRKNFHISTIAQRYTDALS